MLQFLPKPSRRPALALAAASLVLSCGGSASRAARPPETFIRASRIVEHGAPAIDPEPAEQSSSDEALAPPPDELARDGLAEARVAPSPQPAAPMPWPAPERDAARATLSPDAVVARANDLASQAPDETGFINSRVSYAFVDGGFYKVYASPFHVTDIALEPGEELLGPVAGGDPTRWRLDIGTGAVGGVPQKHLYLKPLRPGLETNLVVTTDRRVYLIDLESLEKTFMVSVRWTYPQQDASLPLATATRAAADSTPARAPTQLDSMSFDYAIDVVSGKPSWTPRAVYDDGVHTYVRFDRRLLTGEAPALYVLERGELQLVNYRVQDKLYIVDRLFDVAELRLGNDEQDVVRLRRRAVRAPAGTAPRPSTSSPRRPATPR